MKQADSTLLTKLLISLLCMFCFLTNAHAGQEKSANNIISQVSSTCLFSPFDCLVTIDQVQPSLPPNSPMFFEVLQYKYEALFNLQKFNALYLETEKWIDKPELPILFQITNAIYFAKAALDANDKVRSQQQYQFAQSLLLQMNQQYPSPIRLVQFANLQMALGEHQQAYELLTELAKKHPNSPDSRFMMELHGNMGHVANYLKQPKQALRHWLDTIKWAKIFGNKQQIAVVLFNLADTYARLAQFPQASEYFTKTIKIASEAGDMAKANQARYHLVQVMLKQQQECQARAVFEQIDSKQLPSNYRLQQLQGELKPC